MSANADSKCLLSPLGSSSLGGKIASQRPQPSSYNPTSDILTSSRQNRHRQDVPPIPLLRSSCDSCSRKKNKCTGEMPCERCIRAGIDCRYSTKRKLGRPRTGTKKAPKGRGGSGERGVAGSPYKRGRGVGIGRNAGGLEFLERPSLCVSPATGLAGLAENRYLSCFVEHFNSM